MTRLIIPHWPVPANVLACSSTRKGGVSKDPFNSLNLGAHCGDILSDVENNRQRVFDDAGMPSRPIWLEQVHGTTVLKLSDDISSGRADASWTNLPGKVCAVMTADCLPVLFCDVSGSEVAAAHAGWRGLCSGILEKTVASFLASPSDIMAWLGPAIGPAAFEVGPEVRHAFITEDAKAEGAFRAAGKKYYADLYQLARQRLGNAGITQIYGGEHCTWSQSEDFFSYRRDGVTGRMSSFIWLT